jgi:hypothetical protein
MPLPSSINDLSTSEASNSPAGSESPTTFDNYLRWHASFIAALRDVVLSGTASITTVNVTMTGDLQMNNAKYLKGKLAAGTSTRIFGLNSSNVLYVGGIDAAQSSIVFVRNGVQQLELDQYNNLVFSDTLSAPAAPSSGGILYVQAGQLRYIGSSGTITALAAP